MTKVVLYGNLKEKYGESFTVHISSAAEAITALGEQLPGFYKDIYEGSWCIKRGDIFLDIETVTIGMGDEDLHIIPEAVGAKSEWVPIILGIALMVVAFPSSGGLAAMTTMESVAFGVGVSLALGGISQMLFAPTLGGDPSDSEDAKIRKNGIFGGQWNLATEGQVVPIIYGRMRVGSQVVQNALRTEDFNIAGEIEGTANDLIKTITTNDTLLTMESGEGISSTYIGFQTTKVYTNYGVPYSDSPFTGASIKDSLLELKAKRVGSIDNSKLPWEKRLFSLYERVETKNGEDTLYLCAIFGDTLDSAQHAANRKFLAKISFPEVSDDYQFATLGEDDFTSYMIDSPTTTQRFTRLSKIAQGYDRQTEVKKYDAINGITSSSIDEGKYVYEEGRINVDNTWINSVSTIEVDPEIDYLEGPGDIDNDRMLIAEWNLTNILPGNPTTHQLSLGTEYRVEWDYDK